MKVVLATLNAKFIHASLALRYLRSQVEADFPDTSLLEFTIHDVPMNIVSKIYQEKPDVIGFSCYIWNIEQTVPVLDMLRKVLPNAFIVLGGPEVSYDTRYWMERLPVVDCIAQGEGEATFYQILQSCSESKQQPRLADVRDVRGIYYRSMEGSIHSTFPSDKIAALDAIPSPYETHLEELRNRIVYFEASRGCPFRCQFCLSSIEEGVRYFSLDRIKRDLRRLIDFGVKQIKFVDRTFNINKEYAMEIFKFLIGYHKNTTFHFEITADIMRPEVLEFLAAEAPPDLFRFEIGVQSTNDLSNHAVKRHQNFEKLARTVSIIRDSKKIVQHLDLIAGLPHEDYHSFRKTFNDVFALQPDELQLGFLKMLRGTGMRHQAKQYGYQYMEHAPYEILGNDVLSYSDMIRLKRLEDILEKFWNDHKMDHTVTYLVDQIYSSPFDFFQAFGDFWEANGWQRLGHQYEDLFSRLLEFLKHAKQLADAESNRAEENLVNLNLSVVSGLMQLDYVMHANHRPRHIPWEPMTSRQEQYQRASHVSKQLQNMKDERIGDPSLYATEHVLKHAWVGLLPFDVKQWLEHKRIVLISNQQHFVVLYPFDKQGQKIWTVVF
ncbi:B12-binding domain-containing radical SAM protein [Fodinisporobacter ferrooxydans]|uniref:B12-binding domain-containing radical SAM protein n=1 Tax=Fodinisporobacter ferrooxydans TaxID=2901836 RepID=A0ABY4CKB9_9BACL|nr:B12-binding domain-containing radical SAM protein [Alicyclobacillaceae bacterium MYW30-H2]